MNEDDVSSSSPVACQALLDFVANRITLRAALGHDFVCKLDSDQCRTGACTDF